MTSVFEEIFGAASKGSGTDYGPRVAAALDRVAEAAELSASVAALRLLREQGQDAGADRMAAIVSKLSQRLSARHEVKP